MIVLLQSLNSTPNERMEGYNFQGLTTSSLQTGTVPTPFQMKGTCKHSVTSLHYVACLVWLLVLCDCLSCVIACLVWLLVLCDCLSDCLSCAIASVIIFLVTSLYYLDLSIHKGLTIPSMHLFSFMAPQQPRNATIEMMAPTAMIMMEPVMYFTLERST